MISNIMSDQTVLRNFSTINTNGKAAVAATIVSGAIENNNMSSSNNNNNNNNNNNSSNINNNTTTTMTSQLNGVGCASVYENGYNYLQDKHDYSLQPEISANSYEIHTGHNDFHSYSKSPDQQRSPTDKAMQIDMPDGDGAIGEEDDGVIMASDAVVIGSVGNSIPDHHARRPMNAFLIFCKRHRPVVREKYPNLENRAITKILGDWWAYLDVKDKSPFTDLAKQVS
jgi:HMG box transcription factor BBX